MYKLTTGKPYEFTIKASKLKNFEVEFSFVAENMNYNVKLNKKGNDLFELVIPKELEAHIEKTNYNIFLYSDNNRFTIDSGEIELIKSNASTESINVEITSTPLVEKVENSKSRIELKDLVKKDYLNTKVQGILRDLKRT
jgi:hypothetical protein